MCSASKYTVARDLNGFLNASRMAHGDTSGIHRLHDDQRAEI
jgi:hypothetical protein